MRNPSVMVIATVFNWITFALALAALLIWPNDVYKGTSHSLLIIINFVQFFSAFLQTFFLFKNVHISFNTVDEKSKQRRLEQVDVSDDEYTDLADLVAARKKR